MPKKIHRRRDADPRHGIEKLGETTFADPVNKKYLPGKVRSVGEYELEFTDEPPPREAELGTGSEISFVRRA